MTSVYSDAYLLGLRAFVEIRILYFQCSRQEFVPIGIVEVVVLIS